MLLPYENTITWWLTDKSSYAIIGKVLKNKVTDAQFRYIKQEIEKRGNLALKPFYVGSLANDKMIDKINKLSDKRENNK